jgi:protein SCO1/2
MIPWIHLLKRAFAVVGTTATVLAFVLPSAGAAGEARGSAAGGAGDVDSSGKAPREGDRLEALPARLKGVDISEQLGASLPLDTELRDSEGRTVRLSQFFDGRRPVILTFNYSDCPMLCSLQLSRFVQSLTQMKRTVGSDFQVVTVSIDPAETPERARETKARYLRDYGRPEAAGGWHFLLGTEGQARSVADAVGFSYSYNEERQEWLHAAALMVLTPDGRVARYIYGVDYHPETLNLSIVEGSEGKIGSTMDRLVLYCFHYDESEGRYAPVAMNIMRVGAGLVAVLLGAFLSVYWVAESRKRKLPGGAAAINPGTVS